MSKKNDNENSITITCNITGDDFVRFAKYDTFKRKKAWKSPVFFALIMTGFALICYTVLRDREQSSLLGTVLLAVGLVVPSVWYFMYMRSLREQVKKIGLRTSKAQYFVMFSPDRIHVSKGKETADYLWENVYMLVYDKDVSYLYVDPQRAFLLPDGEGINEMKALAEQKLSADKIIKA